MLVPSWSAFRFGCGHWLRIERHDLGSGAGCQGIQDFAGALDGDAVVLVSFIARDLGFMNSKSLGDRVGQFLGPGNWSPRSEDVVTEERTRSGADREWGVIKDVSQILDAPRQTGRLLWVVLRPF